MKKFKGQVVITFMDEFEVEAETQEEATTKVKEVFAKINPTYRSVTFQQPGKVKERKDDKKSA